jgi:DNA-binding transcriptional regulator YhcF (GntR family)
VNLHVDPDDPTPPYEQLRRQLADLVASGALAPGDRLPPLRQLAGDLGLAVGTVARTYRELEAAGLLASRRGGGTRVADSARPAQRSERLERLHEQAQAFWARARALGFTDEQIEAVLLAERPRQ